MLHGRGLYQNHFMVYSFNTLLNNALPSFDVVVSHWNAPYCSSQQHEEGGEEERCS